MIIKIKQNQQRKEIALHSPHTNILALLDRIEVLENQVDALEMTNVGAATTEVKQFNLNGTSKDDRVDRLEQMVKSLSNTVNSLTEQIESLQRMKY